MRKNPYDNKQHRHWVALTQQRAEQTAQQKKAPISFTPYRHSQSIALYVKASVWCTRNENCISQFSSTLCCFRHFLQLLWGAWYNLSMEMDRIGSLSHHSLSNALRCEWGINIVQHSQVFNLSVLQMKCLYGFILLLCCALCVCFVWWKWNIWVC